MSDELQRKIVACQKGFKEAMENIGDVMEEWKRIEKIINSNAVDAVKSF